MTTKNSYAKGAAKREEVLRTTLEIFGREGARGTTLRAVAKESGISLTGLMHYFDSKDHLLVEVLSASDRRAEVRFYAPDADRDPGELLAAALAANTENAARARLYVTLVAEATDPAHPAHAYFKERFARLRAAIADHLAADERAGRIRPGVDPDFTASAIVAASDGIMHQWLSDPSVDMAGHVRRVWRMLTA
ncbi:TetR/AcrR family transcriptional regulator [Streptomyces sp. NPDC051561]|uniref:TetR/AcrR family transcriptional regulator n=1 Tax=Streptomyces sp. NPDC051561 TaxID=3365658 RepID=UPI0037AE6451